jgi:hypothetical protein
VRRALDLLDWLDQRGQSLDMLAQADLEQWLAEGTGTRLHVRAFINWARSRHLTSDVIAPLPPKTEPIRFIEDNDR